jgi:hypothetical protein
MGAPGLDFETWEIVHSKYEIMRSETWRFSVDNAGHSRVDTLGTASMNDSRVNLLHFADVGVRHSGGHGRTLWVILPVATAVDLLHGPAGYRIERSRSNDIAAEGARKALFLRKKALAAITPGMPTLASLWSAFESSVNRNAGAPSLNRF